MIDTFLIKLILCFFVGSIWITLATIIAERFGTKLGGVIAGLPSTILIALFFIGWTQTPLIAYQATSIVPIIMGIDALFIVIYVLLSRYNFYLSILTSLITWFVLSLGLVFLKFSSFKLSIIGFIFLLALSFYILEKRSRILSESKKRIQYTFSHLLFRGLLSGTIITLAVVMAKIGGPLLGGTFASFPAVMLSTMIITYFAHGKTFSSAVMKVLMVSGTVNVVIYAIAVRYFYLYLGLISGTLISFLISLMCGYLIYLFVNKKMT